MGYNRFGEGIHETTTTTGTGDLTIAATGAGDNRISDKFGTGDNGEFNPIVTIRHRSTNEREVVQGYCSDADTFVRVTVIESSNSNAAVNFSAGTKDVTVGYPASQAYRPDQDLFDGLLAMAQTQPLYDSTGKEALFAGDRWACGFPTATYVDAANSTAEDTGTPGLVKPAPTTPSAISGATGTPIGDMTGGGGLAAAFDGTTSQDYTAGATKSITGSGAKPALLGKDWGSGNTKLVSRVVAYGGNGGSGVYFGNPNAQSPMPFKIQGSNNGSDWTDLYSGSIANATSSAGPIDIDAADGLNVTTAYRYHRLALTPSGTSYTYTVSIAELIFYESSIDNMTLRLIGVTPVKSPAKVVLVARVKHVDETAVAGTDYNFQVSRNGGSNFSGNMTLYDRFTDPTDDCHVIESGPMDVSGQATPSTVVPQMTTTTNKMVELHDIYFRAIP